MYDKNHQRGSKTQHKDGKSRHVGYRNFRTSFTGGNPKEMITTHHRNSHTVDVGGKKFKLYLLSDIHWDNPHCDRVALKKHLTLAKEEGAKVAINGDFFCLMQGKYDPRRSKKGYSARTQ
jgi:hypothetical protein